MRKLFLIALWICSWQVSKAQQMTLSEREDINPRNDDFEVIGNCRQMPAVYINQNGIAEIIFYNKTFKKERISTLGFLPSPVSKIHFAVNGSSMNVFYSVKQNRKLNVYMARMQDDYSWSEPVLLGSSPAGSFRSGNDYKFISSDDQSYTMIFNCYNDSGLTQLHLFVIDTSLKVTTQIEQSFSSDLNLNEESLVSNRGEVYLLAGDMRSAKSSSQSLQILSAVKGSTTLSSTLVNLTNYSVSDLHLTMDDNAQLVYLCGYFSDGKYSSPRGLFYGMYDATRQAVTATHFTPLTLQISTSRTDLRDLKIRNLFLKKTGELEIVTEKAYQTTRNVGSMSPMISSSFMMSNFNEPSHIVHEFSYDEIVVFCLKTDASLDWNQTVLKEQSTVDDNGIFSSFGVLQHRLGNAFLFSDLSSKQARLLACYIASNGELSVKELQTNEEIDEWSLMPRSAVQISKSEIIMPCLSKNYLCFLKISY